MVSALHTSADGTRAVATSSGHLLLDLGSGKVVARYLASKGKRALSSDCGQLATFDGTALRVWDLGDERCRERLAPGGSAGLTAARFSRGGNLLLSGSRLFDGRSGELLATLDLETAGYLEGGPAPGCTEVLDDGVIEAQAFRGLARWDARGRPGPRRHPRRRAPRALTLRAHLGRPTRALRLGARRRRSTAER